MDNELAVASPLTFFLGCFNFLSWGIAYRLFFARKGKPGRGLYWMVRGTQLAAAWILTITLVSGHRAGLFSEWPAAAFPFSVTLASTVLFAWSLHAMRARPPSLAFSPDTPEFLMQRGPYRWVRHPIYAAYLLGFCGMALAAEHWAAWPPVALMATIYWSAARTEERKFTESRQFAEAYRRYQRSTGMFIPIPKI